MIVYLIHGREVKRVAGVILKDDIVPTVNVVSEEALDPALWFKVMVCDSVLVDIDHRHVFWTSDGDPEAKEFHACPLANNLNADRVATFFRKKELLLEDEANCNFDPFLCECFDIASNVFSQMSLQNFDKDGNVSTYQKTMTLVHSFLLPRMTILRQQRDKVKEIQTMIDDHHSRLSNQIEKKNNAATNGERTLKEKRHDFIFKENFMKPSHISALDQAFVDVLVKGIVSDIDHIKKELVQIDIELVQIQKSTDKNLSKHTNELKKSKEGKCKLLEKLVLAHSALKNSQRSSRISGYFKWTHGQDNHHSIYVKIFSHVETLRNETSDLVKANLKISAVREAISFTLAEIDRYGESIGYSRQKGSMELETDLTELLKRPEAFLTVQDRAQLIMKSEKRDRFQGEMSRFCSRIKNRCKRLCDEARMFTDCQFSALNVEQDQTVKSQDNERYIFRSGQESVSVLQHECKKVSEDVVEHISFTAAHVEDHFKSGIDVGNSNRSVIVYMVYEEYVFLDIMPCMCSIYELSRREQCSRLADWLTTVKLHDIGLSIYQVMKCRMPPKAKSKRMLTLERVARRSILSHTAEADVDVTDVRSLYRQLSKNERSVSFVGILKHGIPCTDVEINSHSVSDIQQDKQTVSNIQVLKDECAKEVCDNYGDATGIVCDTTDSSRYPETRIEFHPVGRKHGEAVHPVESETGSQDKSATSPKYGLVIDSNQYLKKKDIDDDAAQRFYEYFQKFDGFVKAGVTTNSLNTKLKELSRSMKYIEKQLTSLRTDVGVAVEICLDDLLDVAVILLFRLEKHWMLLFYAHLNLLIDMIPPFLQSSLHEYALVIYQSAFQFLFDQSLLKKNPEQK